MIDKLFMHFRGGRSAPKWWPAYARAVFWLCAGLAGIYGFAALFVVYMWFSPVPEMSEMTYEYLKMETSQFGLSDERVMMFSNLTQEAFAADPAGIYAIWQSDRAANFPRMLIQFVAFTAGLGLVAFLHRRKK